MRKLFPPIPLIFLSLFVWLSCKTNNKNPATETINALNLKKGEVVLCGPPDKQFGAVTFETSCSAESKRKFDLAIALLHSFEYDEAEKVFAEIIDKEPECAMAYWGVAMSNYHPLWSPPTREELEKGAKSIALAKLLSQKSARESAYIEAMAAFYTDWDKVEHKTRCISFEKKMEKVYTSYPQDKEAAIFYALALSAAADPTDKSFQNQRKAGTILNALYPDEPNHPGIVHYIIHNYDYPELATLALPAARKYASIAPSSAHAQHMPSHIFTRLGLWDECIQSNLAATAAARCYAENAGIKGHWDEELHGLDYLVYAYLQKGENKLAKKQWDYLKTIHSVYPINFKDAYTFAAIPARYLLENRSWEEAASLQIHPADFPWEKFPWQKAIIHFTRLMGSVHMGDTTAALSELKKMQTLSDTLTAQKDLYKANQVQIQLKTAEAWIVYKEGKNTEALVLMTEAAEMEDKTEKHPVTPGEIIPARELLGDMLLAMNQPLKALQAYESTLKKHPKRFNTLFGASLAAAKLPNREREKYYAQQLRYITNDTNSLRPEAKRLFLIK